MNKRIGERVGAILEANTDERVARLLGYGIYEGDFVPTEAVGWIAELSREYRAGNPRIRLDDGKIVYGCECWWDSEATVKARVERWETIGWRIEYVDIDEVRRELRPSEPAADD